MENGWKRNYRWSLDGTYDEMFARVAAAFGLNSAPRPRRDPVDCCDTPTDALLDDYNQSCADDALGGTDFRLLSDKTHSHPSTRAQFRFKRIKYTIPERRDRIDQQSQGLCWWPVTRIRRCTALKIRRLSCANA
ncbi:hypothetical protein BST12_09920 [Mycobacterium angelicum]|uniref:Uncharacterized protein n=1 Tax=Mycobacterium angelicum TaxID=470074 RepID=A0A1W9ZWH0_MYCAN|nr:hypothetical protein [Mycobacterium angelicum]ORA22117.1 hypothetical protein BST12_09920 [Mycobacterium angelicum]